MNTTTIFLSYAFLCISLIALVFFLYFKILVVKTSPDKESRNKIIGEMHDPDTWRNRNNKMSFVSLFWAILSGGIFIYFKYFSPQGVVSLTLLFIYVGVIVLSAFIFGRGGREKAH